MLLIPYPLLFQSALKEGSYDRMLYFLNKNSTSKRIENKQFRFYDIDIRLEKQPHVSKSGKGLPASNGPCGPALPANKVPESSLPFILFFIALCY